MPGMGESGEIRFYCDTCARADRVKMRYWDGRDLDVGGHRDDPDLGPSFHNLVFSLADLGRLRSEDLSLLLEWLDDREVAGAMAGAPQPLRQRIFGALKGNRAPLIRGILGDPAALAEIDPKEVQQKVVETLLRL